MAAASRPFFSAAPTASIPAYCAQKQIPEITQHAPCSLRGRAVTRTSPPAVIVVRPSRSAGHSNAHLADGSELCRSSRQPLLGRARELARCGFDPATRLVMRHAGSEADALRSTVGAAARLTAEDSETGVRSALIVRIRIASRTGW